MKYVAAVLLMAIWSATTVALCLSCIGIIFFFIADEWFDLPEKILKICDRETLS